MLRKAFARFFALFQFRINLRLTRDKLCEHGPSLSGRVLDIGAGDQPYRACFPNVENYVATNTKAHYPGDALVEIEPYTDTWIEDAASLPFEDGSFDGVLCFQVLSLIPDPDTVFREIARVLKEDGVLVLTTDFLYPKWDADDVMRHTDRHLEMLAEKVGMRIERVESYGSVYTMRHCVLTRYIKDYPQQVTAAANPATKVWRLLVLLLYLVFTPLYSIAGYLVYFAERNRRDAFDYTVDYLLICRKKG
jgi:SAM-dependent methyltransferase